MEPDHNQFHALEVQSTTDGDLTIFTPSDTSSSSSRTYTFQASQGPAPTAGSIYLLRDVRTNRLLTLHEGYLCLTPYGDGLIRGGARWHCIEDRGWLGFRETVSSNYLGRDGSSGFRATKRWHESWEFFQVRPHSEKAPEARSEKQRQSSGKLGFAGYHLLCLNGWEMRKMGLKEGQNDKQKLMEVTDAKDAVLWEFIQVL